MKKQSPFRHPVDIRQDDRIADLLATHGHAGYGVYWMILEILHSHETMQVEYCEKTIRRMAAQIGMKHEEFHEMLQDMIIDYDLFEVVDCDPGRGQRGYLRSTITYRKPRKQKRPVTEHKSSGAPATATNAEDTTTSAIAQTNTIPTEKMSAQPPEILPSNNQITVTQRQQTNTTTAPQRPRNDTATTRQEQQLQQQKQPS